MPRQPYKTVELQLLTKDRFTAKTRALRALHEQQLANFPLPAVTADHLSRPAAFGSIGFAYLSKDKIVRRRVQWWRWRTSH